MEWNEKTKALTISWMDLEHISSEGLIENLKWELEVHGIDVSIKDIEKIVVNAQEKIVLGCSRCQGKEEATIVVKSKSKGANTVHVALCKKCWDTLVDKGWK